jgi:hypothetical protein
MKKILILISFIVIGFGCKKVETTTPIGANEGTTAIKFSIATPTSEYPKVNYVPNGTAVEEYLSLSDNDIKVKFEAPTTAPKDLYLEYKTNSAGLDKLNADAKAKDPNYKPFFLLPDSTFKIMVTKDTIKKGQQYAEKVDDNIVVYPSKINPAINYILPLTVSCSSYPSATGTGTIYYYIIGNPLAGSYTMKGIRYNYPVNVPGASGTFDGNPANIPSNYIGTLVRNEDKIAVPLSENTISIDFGNLGPDFKYLITQNNNFAAITADYNNPFKDGNSQVKTWVVSYTPPNAATGVKAKFRILTQYNNNATYTGSDRIWDETFTQK